MRCAGSPFPRNLSARARARSGRMLQMIPGRTSAMSSAATAFSAATASRAPAFSRRGFQGRSKSRTKGHLAASSLIVSTGNLHRLNLCNAASMGLATPQPLLQSAAMSVMRHTARTGSSEPSSQQRTGRATIPSLRFQFVAPAVMPGA